jgi:hypothetical protein
MVLCSAQQVCALLEPRLVAYIDIIDRQNAAIWDKMSSAEREAYLAANAHKGNKRYAYPRDAITETPLTACLDSTSGSLTKDPQKSR